MISIKEYKQDDLLLIKGHLMTLAICIILIAVTFWTASYLNDSAATELEQTSREVEAMRSSIGKIQAEQATADTNIDAYLNLQNAGVIGTEDRLQLLELLAQIRARHELFPININIGEQARLTLPYDSSAANAAKPVYLSSSVLDLSFSLLHEEDFSRLLDDLLGSANLLQPANCTISMNDANKTSFFYLDKHFNASCSMYWYTFNVTAEAEAQSR